MSRRLLVILLLVWVVLRVHFVVRETFRKNQMRDYKTLLSRSLDGKRSYVMGDRLYEFIVFCNGLLPTGSNFALVGIDEASIDRVRAMYYLYPNTEKKDAKYLLVYDLKDAPSIGYKMFAKLDRERYILRKEPD